MGSASEGVPPASSSSWIVRLRTGNARLSGTAAELRGGLDNMTRQQAPPLPLPRPAPGTALQSNFAAWVPHAGDTPTLMTLNNPTRTIS